MKIIFFLMLTIACPLFSQTQVEKQVVNSSTFKGKIGNLPITLFIKNAGIIDCDLYNVYVEGWYYYDKYKIKIPLDGFQENCTMKLFNYGKNHAKVAKALKSNNFPSHKIDSLYEQSDFEESFTFNLCHYKIKEDFAQKGVFQFHDVQLPVSLEAKEISLAWESEFFTLPNQTKINLTKLFHGYGGHQFYSMVKTDSENRIIFSFQSISNHNACGFCGASDGEEGFRIIYFDKHWNVKKHKEYLIKSCIEGIDYTKKKPISSSVTRYETFFNLKKKKQIIEVDKKNASIKIISK